MNTTPAQPAADLLVVASIRRWVADDFEPACRRRGLPLLHSWGLDVPDLTGRDRVAWWTTTEHATRLLAAGVTADWLSPGPTWLSQLPRDLTGREVWAGQLRDLHTAPTSGWAKPAEAKVETLPAQWWDHTSDFGSAARSAGLPDDAWVQLTPTRLHLVEEHRAYVADGAVTTASPYLLADGTTWHEGMSTPAQAEAAAFAQHVVDLLGDAQPPGYTLDVARTGDGSWLVLEGNPAWSSALYGCTADGALDALLAATDHAGLHDRWRWVPDPYLQQRAARSRPLPRR